MNNGLLTRLYTNLFKEHESTSVYYNKNKELIYSVLFRDTFLCAKFIPVYFDLLVITNKSISFDVYKNVKGVPQVCDNLIIELKKYTGKINDNLIIIVINNWINENQVFLSNIFDTLMDDYLLELMKRYKIYSKNVWEILFLKLMLQITHNNEYNYAIKNRLYEIVYKFDNYKIYVLTKSINDLDDLTIDEKKAWNTFGKKYIENK